MKFELQTISPKRFMLITLISTPAIIFSCLGLAIMTSTQWLVYLIIPLLGATFFWGQRRAKTFTKIDLNEDKHLKINNQIIEYRNIIGYFINKNGLTQTALCLRLNTNRTIQITGASVGEQGKAFQKA